MPIVLGFARHVRDPAASMSPIVRETIDRPIDVEGDSLAGNTAEIPCCVGILPDVGHRGENGDARLPGHDAGAE